MLIFDDMIRYDCAINAVEEVNHGLGEVALIFWIWGKAATEERQMVVFGAPDLTWMPGDQRT